MMHYEWLSGIDKIQDQHFVNPLEQEIKTMMTKTNKLTTNWLLGLQTVSARKRRKWQISHPHRHGRTSCLKNLGRGGGICSPTTIR